MHTNAHKYTQIHTNTHQCFHTSPCWMRKKHYSSILYFSSSGSVQHSAMEIQLLRAHGETTDSRGSSMTRDLDARQRLQDIFETRAIKSGQQKRKQCTATPLHAGLSVWEVRQRSWSTKYTMDLSNDDEGLSGAQTNKIRKAKPGGLKSKVQLLVWWHASS